MPGLGRKLTDNITFVREYLALQEGSFEIYVNEIPIVVGRGLALQSETRTSTRRGISLKVPDLSVLETSQYPSCLAL